MLDEEEEIRRRCYGGTVQHVNAFSFCHAWGKVSLHVARENKSFCLSMPRHVTMHFPSSQYCNEWSVGS